MIKKPSVQRAEQSIEKHRYQGVSSRMRDLMVFKVTRSETNVHLKGKRLKLFDFFFGKMLDTVWLKDILLEVMVPRS